MRQSSYVKILEQINQNASAELPRDTLAPAWIGMVAEVHRTEPASEEEKVGPYTEYLAALDTVAIDVEDAVSEPEQALLLAREVA